MRRTRATSGCSGVPDQGWADLRTSTTSVSTTQTNSGLAAGDPSGGPQRTPERKAFDEARGEEPHVKGGHDPDLRPEAMSSVHAPDDIDATPPHGDKLQDH